MGLAPTCFNIERHAFTNILQQKKDSNMPRKKIAAANTESLEVAQDVVDDRDIQPPTANVYYEYTTPDDTRVLLDRYEWSRGLGLSDKNVKKAQAARHREVAKGFATVEEA
jgi:hypothetical protein